MKTKTTVASLLLSLAFAASSCTGTDGSPASSSTPPDANPAAAKDAPPQGSASPAPPPSAPPPPPSPTPPPAGSDAPPANVPEHPPALVGFWGSCDAYTFSTYLLREDGSAVSGISTRPKYGCRGGAPLPPAGEPDEACDCTWSVSGDGPSPSSSAPWRLFLSCEGESGSATIVRLDADTITFEGGDGSSYAYSRLDEPAHLGSPERRRSNAQPAGGRAEGKA
jgi:hypothetical protein